MPLTPPSRDTANTDALANQSTIVSFADQQFIDSATLAINQAVAQGQFQVLLTTIDPQNIQTLHDYFVGLGYFIAYPDLNANPSIVPPQPAEQFGQFWDAYWSNTSAFPPLRNPVKMLISWQ